MDIKGISRTMTTEERFLSQGDVEKLMADPSADTRARTGEKIAMEYERGWARLSGAEREIAEDIFRTLVRDVETRVRQSLANHLKGADKLPRDLALTLANDVEVVALPMIKFSPVLTDDDLIGGRCVGKQVAVAARQTVSGYVADALIDSGNDAAVARLVANEGAELTGHHFDQVLIGYENSTAVADTLSRRHRVPPEVGERIMHMLSQKIETYLVEHQDISPDKASDFVLQARERATVTLLSDGSGDDRLRILVEQLHCAGRLTPSLVLRALCMGDLPLFEMALARLAKVPVENVRLLVHDRGALGLKSIFASTGLPDRLFPVVRAALELIAETNYDGQPYDRERFIVKMIERLLTQFQGPENGLAEEEIDYLLGKLRDLAA
jgi:uncharacterized protein (DUF2336 family)